MGDVQPQSRPMRPIDKYGPKFVEKTGKLHDRAMTATASNGKTKTSLSSSENQPAGGFDGTPIPPAPPGYTLKFTFHRAVNLPFADFSTLSSDPYVLAQLTVDVPKRHKQDPALTFRTHTIPRDTNPVWESEWIVANVPASGFQLKCCLYDEDPADHDDRLGNAYVDAASVDENWAGIHRQSYHIKKRMGSKRVYFFRGVAALVSRHARDGHLDVSVECLGRTPGDQGGQVYTVGPNIWFKHFSPLIGRLTGTKDEVQTQNGAKPTSRYNFQAIQMQFQGPVPPQLYHRYVEFRPFVAGMFTSHSLRGRILHKALHHQHDRIYNFDRTTLHGAFTEPCLEMTQKFLEFVHFAQGGRIFTYVLTLDGQFRFTETGKEFGIDMLSKHTMHSDVSIYIAYSGEFFVRRHKHRHRHLSLSTNTVTSAPATEVETEEEQQQQQQQQQAVPDVSTDPGDYELFIDNDSGTYRPNAEYLYLLREFFSKNLPGLHVTTLDCQKDADRMAALKDEQRERKKNEGQHIMYLQQDSSASSLSISSSDEEALDERAGVSTKHRGDLAQRMHDMRDVKGQVLKWAESDGQPKHPQNTHMEPSPPQTTTVDSQPPLEPVREANSRCSSPVN
ncbi:hypothetical protein ASPZODRAFT_161980 [Penicilliopsis zonata CBS 506.65]|uniref:C2 domain-containing protein n=1 Tax=Penicilliopsis zonata CBS 506.65 TaxID=1073090 RepID=A0A1L9S751_9EURO|nr:hypothetical protein ASPZODRAFT_161980 [Penicilliopsis zonata CBS 506.65]OJJ42997.1 hypothetical protein ASPZODRAFT_161980 [Penicilliopsis zonata CBS 506.65]